MFLIEVDTIGVGAMREEQQTALELKEYSSQVSVDTVGVALRDRVQRGPHAVIEHSSAYCPRGYHIPHNL